MFTSARIILSFSRELLQARCGASRLNDLAVGGSRKLVPLKRKRGAKQLFALDKKEGVGGCLSTTRGRRLS